MQRLINPLLNPSVYFPPPQSSSLGCLLNPIVFVSAGDPVCSERLYPVLVLHSERGRVLPIGDQTDAAECPRPVLYTVQHTQQFSSMFYTNQMLFFF